LRPLTNNNSAMTTKRAIIAALASVLCGWGVWQTARVGLARTLVEYSAKARRDNFAMWALTIARVNDPETAADRAIALSPQDAESYYARGAVLQSVGEYSQAQDAFERAAQLRPRDYYLWLVLGVTRDQNQDQEGALRALRQSVALAPSYAQPHWQLGNLLLRMGEVDQAFSELRQAALGNPDFWPNIIDLAWGIYRHDAGAVVSVLQPDTDTSRMALALFFARNNQSAAAVGQFRQLRSTEGPSRNSAETLLSTLLNSRAFAEAYEVWARLRGLPSTSGTEIKDGGFEEAIVVGQSGFGWQITPGSPNVAMSFDEAEHQSGKRSLRMDFRGNSNPTSPLLTQTMLAKPLTRYHVSVFGLTKEFVSAGDPIITLVDASDPNAAVLAQSPPLRSDAGVWREFAFDFTTNAATQAITINVARQRCANDPCPAFGTLWLDSVSIKNLAAASAPN
jgi:tetratricopeptide (TPR) repeat protein